jgi:hypothetical protein
MPDLNTIQRGLDKSRATKRTQLLARLIRSAPPMRESDVKSLTDLLVSVPRLPEQVSK